MESLVGLIVAVWGEEYDDVILVFAYVVNSVLKFMPTAIDEERSPDVSNARH